jgi:hypothetical protein
MYKVIGGPPEDHWWQMTHLKKMISSIHIVKTHSNIHIAELPERKWWQLLHLNEGRWPSTLDSFNEPLSHKCDSYIYKYKRMNNTKGTKKGSIHSLKN